MSSNFLKVSIQFLFLVSLISAKSIAIVSNPELESLNEYRRGNHTEAMKILDEHREIQTASSTLLRALILRRLGQEQEALHEAERAMTLADSSGEIGGINESKRRENGEVARAARDLIATLNSDKSRISDFPFWAYGQTSLAIDDNIYQDSTAPTSKLSDSLSFGAGYDFSIVRVLGGEISAGPFMGYRNYMVPGLKGLSESLTRFGLEIQGSFDYFGIELEAAHENYDLGGVAASSGMDLKIDASTTIISNYAKLGLALEQDNQKASAPAYSYLEGPSTTQKSYLEFDFFSSKLQVFYEKISNLTGDMPLTGGELPMAYKGQDYGFNLLTKLDNDWSFVAKFTHYTKKYDNPALPSGTYREDQLDSTFIKLKYSFMTYFSIYSSWQILENVSTLGSADIRNKNYNNKIWSLGVGFDY